MNTEQRSEGLVYQLKLMRLGARVRTEGGIYYAMSDVQIEPGTLGTIRVVTGSGALVGVEWDGDKRIRATFFDSLEVLAS